MLCSVPKDDVNSLSPCDHEEADTQLLLHVKDATDQSLRKVMIQIVDT